jgi:hypothetical protein
MESEAPKPERDPRQVRIDHAEMLASHKARIQRRREWHAKRRFIRKVIPINLI